MVDLQTDVLARAMNVGGSLSWWYDQQTCSYVLQVGCANGCTVRTTLDEHVLYQADHFDLTLVWDRLVMQFERNHNFRTCLPTWFGKAWTPKSSAEAARKRRPKVRWRG